MPAVKFTTTTTGSDKPKPVAVMARQRMDAVVGSIIQIDGRESYDPQKLPLTWKWRFVQVPIGSALIDSSFHPIRPKSRAVSFTPDKIGVYLVELVVNNGEQDSDPITAHVSLQISRVPCGENLVPDAHFLWDYISDFWKLVDDRYAVEAIWSSVIQILGSELITLWDTDNNKSVATIQERFQRRWQAFNPVTELIDETRHRIITGKTDSGSNALSGVFGAVPGSGNTSIIYTDLGEPRDITATDFTNLKGNFGDRGRVIVVNGDTYTINRTENNEDDSISLVFVDEVVVPDGLAGVSWRVPHLLHMSDVDLEDVGARAGDVLVFEVTRQDVGLSAELRVQVVGVDRHRLGFEFTLGDLEDGAENIDIELFKQLVRDLRIVPPDSTDSEAEAVAKTVVQFIPIGINLNTRPFTKFRLAFKAKKIVHNTIIEADDTISSVPALQEKIKDAPIVLRENLDYIVEDGKIQFVSGLFTPEDPAPENLWAECVWYDNDVAIENNFGRLVNLKKETLTESATRAPYLSAVKGLMYAYTNSADVGNLRLALQILLGLPFSEERGIVLEIDEDFSTDVSGNTLGRILMEDLGDDNTRTGIRRFYFYSPLVGLEVNRGTGELFKVGDIVEQFSPLSKGVEVKDYIKDPNWWQGALVGLEILKFFTFQVTIDSKVFDANDVSFARQVLDVIKPAYVRVVTAILASFEEDIEVTEVFGGAMVLKFYDNTRGLESADRVDDYNRQGAVLSRAGSHPLSTRIPQLLRGVETKKNTGGTAIEVVSAVGWDADALRGRDSSTDPVIEGDQVYLHEGQPGAGVSTPGIYEIASVIDANTLELLASAPGPNPVTFQTAALDPDYFMVGTGLTASILRRETNPVLRGDDITFALGNVASSPTANFLLNNVGPGDHLIIEAGVNAGEYYITELPTPPVTFISETQLAVLNLDGSVPTLVAGPSPQYFRIIRPSMAPRRIEGAWSRYNGTSFQMELLVPDPDLTTSNPFDIFTPAMVGGVVNVTNSEDPVNDGDFFILVYLGPGKVAINSGSSTDDASPQSVITIQ